MISRETLRFFPLFANQNDEMLTKIAALADEMDFEAGQQLWNEGDSAKSLYLILGGSVVLSINMGEIGEPRIQELEPIGVGEVVGWSSIVAPHVYKLSAHTDTKSHLIVFNGEKLRQLFDNYPTFGYYFVRKLAEVIGERYLGKCIQLMSMVD